MHAQTYTFLYASTGSYIDICTHVHMYTCNTHFIHVFIHAPTGLHMHAYTLAQTSTRLYMHTCIHAPTCLYIHSLTYITLAPHAYIHTCIHTLIQTCLHTHTHAHPHHTRGREELYDREQSGICVFQVGPHVPPGGSGWSRWLYRVPEFHPQNPGVEIKPLQGSGPYQVSARRLRDAFFEDMLPLPSVCQNMWPY